MNRANVFTAYYWIKIFIFKFKSSLIVRYFVIVAGVFLGFNLGFGQSLGTIRLNASALIESKAFLTDSGQHQLDSLFRDLEYRYLIDDYVSISQQLISKIKAQPGSPDTILGKYLLEGGKAAKASSRFQESIQLYSEAAIIFERNLPNNGAQLANAYYNLGHVYFKANEDANARLFLEKSNELCSRFRNDRIRIQNLRLEAGLNLFQGQFDQGRYLLFQALNMTEELFPSDSVTLAGIHSDLSVNYIYSNRFSEAEPHISAYWRFIGQRLSPMHPEIRMNTIVLSTFHRLNKQFDLADQVVLDRYPFMNQTHLDSVSSVSDLLLYSMMCSHLGSNYYDRYLDSDDPNWVKKQLLYEEASLEALKQHHLYIGDLNSGVTYFRLHNLMEGVLSSLVVLYQKFPDHNLLDKVFHHLESIKDYNSYQQLSDIDINLNTRINFSIKNKFIETRAAFIENEKEISFLASQRHSDNQLINRIQERQKLKQSITAIQEEVSRASGNLFTNDQSWTLDSLQNQLSTDELVIHFYQGASNIFMLGIARDTVYFRSSSVSTRPEKPILDFRTSLVGSKNSNIPSAEFIALGSNLFKYLFGHVESELKRYRKLIFIPDQEIGYLPMEAIFFPPKHSVHSFDSLDFLVRHFDISYNYSGRSWHNLLNRRVNKKPGKLWLGIAPEFKLVTEKQNKGSNTDTTAYVARTYSFKPLLFSQKELDLIHNVIGKGDIRRGLSASEMNFMQSAGKYRIIHLATHGVANQNEGEHSYIAFTPIDDTLENELLYHTELYNLDLNADMVVLSACETGFGEVKDGQGVVSLGRGIANAGANSIVTSLWAVDDEQTGALMALFYQYLKEGMRKDEALRKAKLDMMNTDLAKHPYFWSGFIAIGDMTPIDWETSKWINPWLLLIGGTGFLLAAFWIFRNKQRKAGTSP